MNDKSPYERGRDFAKEEAAHLAGNWPEPRELVFDTEADRDEFNRGYSAGLEEKYGPGRPLPPHGSGGGELPG